LRAPPILDPLVFYVATGIEAPDLIGAGSQRHVEGRFLERARGIISAGEDRQLRSDEQRNVACAVFLEMRHQGGVVRCLGTVKFCKLLTDDLMTLILEQVERKGDVVGGERRTVVEARLRSQEEAVGAAVGENRDGPGRKAVTRVGLVPARFISLANVRSIPSAASPRKMKPLSELKVRKF